MKTLKFKLMIFILTFATLYSLNAQPMREGDKRGMQRERIEDKLNLTEKQEETFNKIQSDHRIAMIDLKAEIDKNRENTRLMIENNKINETELLSLVDKNNQLHADMKKSSVKMWLDIYKILDENQKELWTEHFQRIDQGMMRIGNRMDVRDKLGRLREMRKN